MRFIGLVTLGACLSWSQLALATEPPAVCDELILRAEARRARDWRYGWAGANAVLMAGSFMAVPFVGKEERPDWIVGGVGSAVSVLTTWFWPLRVEAAEAELRALPSGERGKHLPRLVRESAADQRERIAWPWHLANVGVSAVAGGILAFGYERYESGLITMLTSVALGEAQLLTQPTGLPKDCSSELALVPRLRLLRAPDQRITGGVLALGAAF